jgi:pimeloyl-ACP methyl ester carboxylesterase
MPQLPEGFVSRTAMVKDFKMHYVMGGSGEPVVIVHGGWDSWWAWHEIIPTLAETHTVIMPALRGLAKSAKPADGYDADNLGDDLYQLINGHLGFERYAVVGHDWGAVAAYTLAAQHPEAVSRLAIFEMAIPGVGIMEQALTPQPGGQFLWHMGWHSVPDVPEMLIAGHLREYMQWFFSYFGSVPDAVSQESLDHYVGLYSEAGALRAFMRYYQNFWVHAEQVKQHMSTKLPMPVMGYGGDASLGDLTRVCMEQLADDVTGGSIPNCGHWIAEEAPDFVGARLSEFLSGRQPESDAAAQAVATS